MKWWCAATGEAWTWQWQAYPGVWLFVALLGILYWWATRRGGGWAGTGAARQVDPPAFPPSRLPAKHAAWFIAGLLAIWVALDWPLGALGAGYLASAHSLSYVLLSLIAPPCLILGMPRGLLLWATQQSRWGVLLRLAARPWFGLILFNAILMLTHLPDVVDGLLSSQLGVLAVDLGWLIGGLALWWPVMGPSPEVVRLKRPLKLAYLFASTLLPIIPSAFLTFAQYPFYATYELAPRVFPLLTAIEDQKVAGLIMKLVGDLPIWLAFGVVFFRWAKESTTTPPPACPSPVKR